jgi:hypothetical protein
MVILHNIAIPRAVASSALSFAPRCFAKGYRFNRSRGLPTLNQQSEQVSSDFPTFAKSGYNEY